MVNACSLKDNAEVGSAPDEKLGTKWPAAGVGRKYSFSSPKSEFAGIFHKCR